MLTLYGNEALHAYCRSIYGNKKLLLTEQVYTDTQASVPDGATVGGNIQISQNADFILLGFGFSWPSGLASLPVGKLLFSDSGSGEQFMSRAAYLSNCATQQSLAFQRSLHYPRFIGGNSSVSYTYTNESGGHNNNITVSIVGFNVREYA